MQNESPNDPFRSMFSRLGHPLNWLVSSARCSTCQQKSTNTHPSFLLLLVVKFQPRVWQWIIDGGMGWMIPLGAWFGEYQELSNEYWNAKFERRERGFTLTQPRIRGLYESVMLHSHACTHTPYTLPATTSFSLILPFILHSISFKSSMMLCCNAMFLRRNILLSVI